MNSTFCSCWVYSGDARPLLVAAAEAEDIAGLAALLLPLNTGLGELKDKTVQNAQINHVARA